MSSSKRVDTGIVALIVGLVVVAIASSARADQRVAAKPATADCPKPPPRIEIVGKGTTLCIPVYPGLDTRIDLPDGARVYSVEGDEQFLVGEMPALLGVPGGEARAYLSAKSETPVGTEGIAKLMAPTFDATFRLRRVDSPDLIQQRIDLVYLTEAQAEVRRLQAQLDQSERDRTREAVAQRAKRRQLGQQLATANGQLTATREQLAAARTQVIALETELSTMTTTASDNLVRGRVQGSERAVRERLAVVAEELDRGPRLLEPIPGSRSVTTERLRVEFEQVKWEGDHLLVWTNLHGLADRPYRLTDAKVLADDHEKDTWIVMPRAVDTQGIIATIYKGETERVAIAVKLGPDAHTERMELNLFEYGNPKALKAQMPPEYRDGRILYPVSQEELDAEQRERERLARGKQSFISLQAKYGAFWIADGFGNGKKAATSFTGIGLRYTMGIVPMAAFEAEVIGLWTGSARFSDVDVDGAQGDLDRRATLARAQIGGVLRFGDKLIPTARVGIGGQAGSFGADMTADGGAMSAVDSSFEFNGFVTFGGGVDVRLGEQLLAGISAAAELPLGGSDDDLFRRSLNISGHFGYGW